VRIFEKSMERELGVDGSKKLDNWGLLRIFKDVFGFPLLIQFFFVFAFF
jgi:hypothetical protein